MEPEITGPVVRRRSVCPSISATPNQTPAEINIYLFIFLNNSQVIITKSLIAKRYLSIHNAGQSVDVYCLLSPHAHAHVLEMKDILHIHQFFKGTRRTYISFNVCAYVRAEKRQSRIDGYHEILHTLPMSHTHTHTHLNTCIRVDEPTQELQHPSAAVTSLCLLIYHLQAARSCLN